MSARLTALLVVTAFPAVASANLMTFDGIQKNSFGIAPQQWTEDGITASGTLGWWTTPNTQAVERSGSWIWSFVTFTMGGELFTPDSVDIKPGGSGYCAAASCTPTLSGEPIDYIRFSGYLNGLLVSDFGVFRPRSTAFETFELSALGAIDELRIGAKDFRDLGLSGSCTFGCGVFDIDNLVLNPVSVPEPATLTLLGAGLLGMIAARRRARP